ncbi:MAG TPA: hypothetical protein VFQ69_07125 [Rhizomicrobium sp.]|nr:hypothetical protein [Rhizomicrobium sp.]
MRNAKSIGVVIGTLLVSAFFAPTWQWYWGRFLDAAAKDGTGVRGAVVHGLHMISPLQQALYGAAAGMLLALAIGYAHVIALWGRRVGFAVTVLPRFLPLARPGVHSIGGLEGCFPPYISDKKIILPEGVVVVNVGLNRSEAYLTSNSNGMLHLARASVLDMHKPVVFGLNMWGRWRLLALLKLWFRFDLAAFPIDREQASSAFEHLMWDGY